MKYNIKKSLLSWLLVFSMILPLMSSVIYTQAADSDLKDYDSMTMEEIFTSDESLTWVITGDSITHNGNWTAGLNSYGEWFEQYLYDIDRGDDSVVLSGWGGAATDDFQTLANTNSGQGTYADPGMGIENFVTKYNPDVITIKLGMNDRYITKATFIKQYKQMLDSIYSICETEHKKIPKIVVLTPTPIASENLYDDEKLGEVADGVYESTSRQRNALEDIVKEYNAAGKHMLFCDLRTAFLTEAQALGDDYVNTFFQDPSDGAIHPNGAGQYCIFKNLCKTMGIDVDNSDMPIFNIEYADLVSHALYVDSTDGLNYTGHYDSSDAVDDEAEMIKTMPTLTDATPISSVEFDSTTGVVSTGGSTYIDISEKTDAIDPLTLDEVQKMGKEFTLVFRARTDAPAQKNAPILAFASNDLEENTWDNAFALGAQGYADQCYYQMRKAGSTLVDGENTFSVGANTTAGDGTWHTIAIVQREASFEYYVDGVLAGSNTSKILKASIGDTFADAESFSAIIGSYGGKSATSYTLVGCFDYWQFYDEALTADQVFTLAGDDAGNDTSSEEKASWSDTVVENNVWAVAGGAQMSGYEGIVVNRSLMRYIENAMRGSSGVASYRDIHMYNLASADYDVATLVKKFDTLAEERAYDVFMLLPEVPEVYESDYVHSDTLVATYKKNIKTLLSKNSGKVVVLWTPFASNDAKINGYIDDYANAVREIASSDTTILFFDANQFMNDSMKANTSLLNNWFEDGQYVSPLCNVDVARAFYETMGLSGTGKGELSSHNLRYTSDAKIYKGNYAKDNIASTATVNGTSVSVDVSAVVAAYPNAKLSIAVLPYKTVENYNEDTVMLADVAEVTVSGNVYTFEAPCADLHLAIYGEQAGVIYRFKDISLNVNTTATIPTKTADGVYLDSLEVMSAPAIGFDKDTTTYNVDLYQYQTYASVRATAQAGLTIKVNGSVVASGAVSKGIKVEDGSVVTVEVTDGTETKAYTLNLKKASSPDIIITEVMTDGYMNYTASGNDNYELIEIYNASGKDLNLLDYSVGYKKDYTYNTVNVGNGAEFPYYFTGNNLAVSKETHAGIKEITKYSMYWKDKGYTEPDEVIFKADSTMVIWVKFSPQSTEEARKEYGATLTYETLIAALEKHKGTHTLSVDIDGTEKAVVPQESQIVVAEASVDMASGSISSAAAVTAENSQKNWYLENHGAYNAGGQQTRSWLFILKDTAEVASNGKVTEAGNDIISAAKYVRPGSTNKLSSVFSYNFERGMSLVKNENVINDDLIGIGNTSDVSGYSNLTSFGAIEYWQKPADLADTTAPTYTNKTLNQIASGAEGTISIDLADDTDIRYVEVYVRKSGEDAFTKIATDDLVLESGVLNAGLSKDITNYTYTCSVGKVTGTVEYYVTVQDGNGNVAQIGTVAEPCTIKLVPKVVEDYSVGDAAVYFGEKAPECSQAGYLFAGWYADAACVSSPLQSLEGVSGTVYALFVTEEVLSVRAQISSNLGDTDNTNDTAGSIRFVTTVDSLNYSQVGFDIAYDKDGDGINETTANSASNKVYKLLYAVNATTGDTMEYYPTIFSDISVYFKACTVTNVPQANFGTDFTVTPYWITLDGIRVEGVTAVKSINDGIYGNAEAEIDGTYYNELEQAIEAANANADATTIIVLNDAEVESQMSITTDITIQSEERENITIYRGAGLATADMFAVSSGATLTIKDAEDKGAFVLDGRTYAEAQAGTARDSAAGSTGSLISNNGTVNLTNITVQYVKKTVNEGDGGVIYNASGATVKVEDSVFDNNYTTRYGSVVYTNGGMTVENSVFTNNAGNNGGVICHHDASSTMTIDKCYFENNTGASGAVIWANKPSTITNTTFKSNTASSEGGAIRNSGSNMILTNNVFDGNKATTNGGAICTHGTAPIITDCKFVNNQTTGTGNGGAIYAGSSRVVTLQVSENPTVEALFEGNTSAGYGGAIGMGSGTLILTGYKFSGNTATGNGGAIYGAGDVTVTITASTSENSLVESIFEKNTAAGGGAVWINGDNSKNTTYAEANITGYTFEGNSATDNHAGAIYVGGAYGITTNIDNCKFVENKSTSQRGGAIYGGNSSIINLTANSGSDLAIFQENTALQGGAICVGSGTLNVTGYTFDANYTSDAVGGGAIKLNDNGITANLTECVFTNNTAQKGGAICADSSDATSKPSSLKIKDCSFVGNKATGLESYVNDGGGAIYANVGVTITLEVTDSTKAIFQNNTSGSSGGAIYFLGTLEGSGYTFASNSPDDIDAREGSTNNYQ